MRNPNNLQWKASLRQQLLSEINFVQRHISLKRTPPLILTGMGFRGSFEISWSYNKDVIFILATTKTWDYILNEICKCGSNNASPRILEDKKNDFLSKISKKPESRNRLGINDLPFYKRQIRKTKPWREINDNSFGKWVELSTLLPSFIDWRFGPNLELAKDQQKNILSYVKQYAEVARTFFDSRGRILGYEVGESGLWINSIPQTEMTDSFPKSIIYGLGGRSDIAILSNDNSGTVEYWDLKTRPPSKSISRDQLIKQSDLQQVATQAPMQLILPNQGQLPIPDVYPVKTIGILGIGTDDRNQVIWKDKEALIPERQTPILGKTISTERTAQWHEQLGNSERVELAADILRQAAQRLIEALVQSDEWELIKEALDEHWRLKYNC
ncbi:hypothetical protein [Phormidium sp. FACHB-1136]|uniref:hypothetical protein n=1 Tax=Phormidium sp. FACHB-1136 TaxID=2692848 RepID=UPI001684017C|nr:hypothetical protein [Phormidium sp. FACHB-1136]MBD2426840.1 hypothetical protein [Phormidium sp. FACHB-1136]